MYAPILVYINDPEPGKLKEILSGIEEEGVLFVVSEQTGNAMLLSRQAADASALGCGIGCCAEEAALSVANTSGTLFHIQGGSHKRYRILGQDAGRYIKKQAFIQ